MHQHGLCGCGLVIDPGVLGLGIDLAVIRLKAFEGDQGVGNARIGRVGIGPGLPMTCRPESLLLMY